MDKIVIKKTYWSEFFLYEWQKPIMSILLTDQVCGTLTVLPPQDACEPC